MNVADSEVVVSILQSAGHKAVNSIHDAEVVLLNTCAIREGAEAKVLNRLEFLSHMHRGRIARGEQRVVGVLGCMAERLRERLLDRGVAIVAGPDAYRDLPRLLDVVVGDGDVGVNVALSTEETYADVAPVRRNSNGVSAFVTVMRGCNNMCTFCIVPFTRGRERSRPLTSIVDEVRTLVGEGYKEVTLLGQNVNSYHDSTCTTVPIERGYAATPGFGNTFRTRDGGGARFVDLLDSVAAVSPELRVRFTSPHPKDFPPEVLGLVRDRPNVCCSLHLPVQSGSSAVLQRMRRNYTREAFLELVHRTRELIPGVGLSTDVIAGFCGETEEEHSESLSLLRECRFDQAFMFAYSMREGTAAQRRLSDDVPQEVKARRLEEVISVFQEGARAANVAEVGRRHLVLVEGPSRRSTPEVPQLAGRTDTGKTCVLPARPGVSAGAYVDATIESASPVSLLGRVNHVSSIAQFYGSVNGGACSKVVPQSAESVPVATA